MAIGRIPEPGTGIPESIIAAKGDLIVGTANDAPGILSVGTNGHTLVANSSETTGLEWVAPAASGGANWTLLNSGGTALTGAQAVTISGISGKESILVLISAGSSANASSYLSLRINGDTGSNYFVAGGFVRRDATFGNGTISGLYGSDTYFTGPLMGSNAASQGGVAFLISGCNSSGAKVIEMNGGCDNGGGTGQWFSALKGYYSGSATVTSVSAFSSSGNWDAGTVFVYATA